MDSKENVLVFCFQLWFLLNLVIGFSFGLVHF